MRASWRPTREGWLWLLTGLLLVAIGVGKNINALALLGYVLFTVLALNALAAGRRLRRLEARRHHEELLFSGVPCRVEVRLRNGSDQPCVAVWLEGAGGAGWYFDRLEGHARHTCQAEEALPARGWVDWPALVASSAYPFGLVRRRVPLGTPLRVLVLPRPGRLVRERLRQHLRGADPHGERIHRRGWRHDAAQADFHGLRPFRPGDSPRWIHWRTSARRGELMVREFEDVPGDDLFLVLDATAGSANRFEEAVSLAASVVWEWCRRRGDRLTLAVAGGGAEVLDGLSGPEHARDLLGRLALVRHAGGGKIDLDSLCVAAPPRSAVVVVGAGPGGLAADLEAHLGRPATCLDVGRQREWDFYTPP